MALDGSCQGPASARHPAERTCRYAFGGPFYAGICTTMHVSVRAAGRARSIGELVREERKAQGLLQDDLALASGLSERTIHAIERGKPTITFAALYSVLEVLGLDVMVCPREQASGRLQVRLRE